MTDTIDVQTYRMIEAALECSPVVSERRRRSILKACTGPVDEVERFVPMTEACELMGISSRTVYRLIADGTFTCLYNPTRISVLQIEAYNIKCQSEEMKRADVGKKKGGIAA